jgi:hypothetical protein
VTSCDANKGPHRPRVQARGAHAKINDNPTSCFQQQRKLGLGKTMEVWREVAFQLTPPTVLRVKPETSPSMPPVRGQESVML